MTELFDPTVLSFIEQNKLAFFLIAIWSLIWKGFALWRSARLTHKYWFIAFLLIQSIGILEIIYIYLVARRYTVESKELQAK